MSIIHKLRDLSGIITYMRKFNIGINYNKDRDLNEIFVKFGKENNIKIQKSNSKKYKGKIEVSVNNASIIQEHFKTFANWINVNYKKNEY